MTGKHFAEHRIFLEEAVVATEKVVEESKVESLLRWG